MEIILLEKVQNLGDIGDLATVRNGYARNFLIPQKKAMRATAEAKLQVEERRRQLAVDESSRLQRAQTLAEQAIREISLFRLCSDEGRLYGSVSPADIAEEITKAGVPVEKSEISQPDGPIKDIGDFEADVILHPEVRFTVRIHVQGGEQSEDFRSNASESDVLESDNPESDAPEPDDSDS